MNQPADHPTATLVAGVVPDYGVRVVEAAVGLARSFRGPTRIVCAHVNTGRYVVHEHPDGSVSSAPIDPDVADSAPAPFPVTLRHQLESVFALSSVAGEMRELAGDPATALSHLAELMHAVMIVVGTRRPGLRGVVDEFFAGSVAAHLAHRQHRPVLVVPQAPTVSGPLPWEHQA